MLCSRSGQLPALRWRGGSARLAALLLVAAVGIGTASCTAAPRPSQSAPVRTAARTRIQEPATSVLAGPADVIAENVTRSLFTSAPVVVVASPGQPADLAAGAKAALRAHAPLLLTSAQPTGPRGGGRTVIHRSSGAAPVIPGTLRAQIKVLDPRTVLAVGMASTVLAAQLPGIRVVTNPAMLPATEAPVPLGHLALLVDGDNFNAATLAAVTTARAAGARVITVRGTDPRADPAAIAALSAARPRQVLAVGAGFGPASQLASRIAVTETGVQLPGGGQVMFPGRLLVALYGTPGTPGLGALGQQDLPASIARARRAAAPYRALSRVPVIPTFEIIATVAQAHPGRDGGYSYESPVASLRPWVKRATADGMYVILDLQPGRDSLLAQARMYQSLLELPDVGLALDPEWKLAPGQLPLHQIGSVSITEVNSVITWLAGLTARHRLPQKLLVLHQFLLSMIQDENRLDTRYQDLAILIHMDGQGTPSDKQQTWDAVTGAAPAGVFFGWKDFYVKDHPMIGPRETIARTPRLSMISYQ